MIEKKYVEIFTERVDGGRDMGHTYGVTKLLEFHMIYRTKKVLKLLKCLCTYT